MSDNPRLTRTAPLGLRIRPEIREALDRAAEHDGISVTDWTEATLRDRLVREGYLERPKRPPRVKARPKGTAP